LGVIHLAYADAVDITRKIDAFATRLNGGRLVNPVTAANRENRETRHASRASPPPLE
jgi:hypothetical protein